jgi:flagellar basal body rod protein FlgC
MSTALSISSSAPAAAILRQQLPARNVANSPSTESGPTGQVPDPNASSTAAAPPAGASGSVNRAAGGTPAFINSISAGAAPRSDPAAPAAAASTPATPRSADLTNQIVQQNAVSQTNAANAKAIQSGSSAISSFLDIKV